MGETKGRLFGSVPAVIPGCGSVRHSDLQLVLAASTQLVSSEIVLSEEIESLAPLQTL